jgi:hypothetical protein
MTRTQLIARANVTEIKDTLLRQIIDVLVLANWRAAERSHWKALEVKFGQQLASITQLALELNRDMGVNVVSDDLQPAIFYPGTKFNPLTMEEAYPDDEAGMDSELVLCTTGLGIWKRTGNNRQSEMILKPRVMFRAALEQLIA